MIRVNHQLCPCSLKSELTFGVTISITLFMSVAKVTISIESNLLKKVDRLVKERVFANRSQAVQAAVEEKVSRLDKNRLARECAKLNKAEEQSLADLGLASEAEEWLEY
jgi:Arc/MetJ-type ribon-helix-helix transcriptional regulator